MDSASTVRSVDSNNLDQRYDNTLHDFNEM